MKLCAVAAAIGLAITAPAHAGIVINEIMQNPGAVPDADGEWFELFNTGASAVDINGWTILDNDIDAHVISASALVIGAGEFLVLGRNADAATNGGVTIDYAFGNSLFIANGADELILLDDRGTGIDRVEYDGGPQFPDPRGASMALTDASADNNVGASWTTSTNRLGLGDLGTPGACNRDVGQICDAATPVPAPATLLLVGLASTMHRVREG